MPDQLSADAEPTDLASALIELRHARAEIERLRPFVDMCDQAQRDTEAAEERPARRYVVSDNLIWRALRDDRPRFEQVRDWLLANGIKPRDVPAASTIAIEPTLDGGAVIRHTVYVRADDGQYVGPLVSGRLITEERVVPMTTPLLPWRSAAAPSKEI